MQRLRNWMDTMCNRVAARHSRIATFRERCEREGLDTRPGLAQALIDEAAEQGDAELLALLYAEKAAAVAIVARLEDELGTVPWHARLRAIHRLVERRLKGLDLKGWRWAGQKFSWAGAPLDEEPEEPSPEELEVMYREKATGRLLYDYEYRVLGGPRRPADFTRLW